MRNNTLLLIGLLLCPLMASAQFYTITKTQGITHRNADKTDENKAETPIEVEKKMPSDSTSIYMPTVQRRHRSSSLKTEGKESGKKKTAALKLVERQQTNSHLPELTLDNLYRELKRNGILFPKIVLAQAILETGWFSSNTCRTKNNLFGLTNPRTGKYFTFNHWTESVRAYYTKVQYRFKGGNYLLWLRDIGYAEDPGYIRAVIKVLKGL